LGHKQGNGIIIVIAVYLASPSLHYFIIACIT